MAISLQWDSPYQWISHPSRNLSTKKSDFSEKVAKDDDNGNDGKVEKKDEKTDKPFVGDNFVDSDNQDWIPPKRPLVGDKGNSHMFFNKQSAEPMKEGTILKEVDIDDDESKRLEEEYERRKNNDREAMNVSTKNTTNTKKKTADTTKTVDWMQTRRASPFWIPTLGTVPPTSSTQPARVGKGGELIPVVHHTLLTRQEIETVMNAYGGKDIVTLMDDPDNPRMDGPLGQIVVTAPSVRHMRQLASMLTRELRKRKLEEVGVQSAIDGPEGSLHDPDEVWLLVNCRNFIVHVQMERARKYYKLEYLWSFEDPIWKLDADDEAAWDNYMENVNPISPEYAPPNTEWDKTWRKLERNRYTAPHRPVVRKTKKSKRRRFR